MAANNNNNSNVVSTNSSVATATSGNTNSNNNKGEASLSLSSPSMSMSSMSLSPNSVGSNGRVVASSSDDALLGVSSIGGGGRGSGRIDESDDGDYFGDEKYIANPAIATELGSIQVI
jgi:hypothetical protein